MRIKIVGVVSIFFMAMMLVIPMGVVAAEDTIKIGVMDPFSGSFKDLGDRYFDGVSYAAKIINESGGLLGKKVEAIAVDTEMKPDVATRKAQSMILKEGVKFFTGGGGSSVGAAMEQLAEKQNVIMISYGMAAASMTGEKCSKNFFRTCGNTDQQSAALATIVANKGYKKIAVIAPDYSFGREAADSFKKKLAKLDPSAKIVADLYPPTGTKDYAPYVSQLITANPDIIFTPNFSNDLTLFIKQSRAMGMKQKIIGYYMNDDLTIKALGDKDDIMVGNIGSESYDISIPTKKNQEFVAKFYKDKGYYPSWITGRAALAILFLAEAIKKAGTTDVDAVIKAWEGLTYDSPAGPWTMRACDHQVQLPFWYLEITKKNKFYKHAFVGGSVTMIPAKDVEVPCEETGCKMKK